MYGDQCLVPGIDQQYYYEILINIDNNTVTGGPYTVVQGNETPHAIPAIDYIVRAGGSTLIGNGQGLGGSRMVEFSTPLGVFSSPLPGNAVGIFHASMIGPNDYTAAFPLAGRVTAIPVLERWGLLALALLLLAAAGWLFARRRTGALTAVVAVALLLGAGGALRALNGGFVMEGSRRATRLLPRGEAHESQSVLSSVDP